MIQGDPHLQRAHLLLEFVEDAKVTIDTVVFRDELQERHPDIPEDYVVTLVQDVSILDGVLGLEVEVPLVQVLAGHSAVALPQLVDLLLLGLDDVVPDLKDRPFVFQVLEDFRVHLEVHLKNFAEDRIQAIVQHPCLILCVVLHQLRLSAVVIVRHDFCLGAFDIKFSD